MDDGAGRTRGGVGLANCEIRDHVQHLVDGLTVEDPGRDWVEIVRGLRQELCGPG